MARNTNYNRYTRARRARRSMRPRMPVPESKYFNQAITHSGTESTQVLTAIASGTSTEQRVGRKIKLKSILMNLSGVGSGIQTRCILYVPKVATQELSLSNPADAVDNDQYWVLRDWWMADKLQNQPNIYTHTFPMGLNVEYTGTAAATPAKNAVKLYMTCTGIGGSISGHTKVWYTDV